MTIETNKSLIHLTVWIAVIYGLAAIAGYGSLTAPEVYKSFTRPTWAPPGSIFGPVWATLYTMIAISGWLVWPKNKITKTKATFALFVAQMLANVLWSWFFFAWQSGLFAFLNILLLVILLLSTITAFWRLNARVAALLLVPYLIWVSFAAYLNFTIWQMNPTLL